MKLKNLVAVICLLNFISIVSFSQTKPLSIGDIVPDYQQSEIINFKNSSIKLSDFKGKLLILDFWATWCSPCVAMLPKTDSLQKIFNGKVQFLPVAYQDKSTVEAFLDHLKKNKNVVIPSIVNDRILNSAFLHRGIPFYVWINENGKVVATTEEKEINEQNIKNVLAGSLKHVTNVIGTSERKLNRLKPVFIPSVAFDDNDTSIVSLQTVNLQNILCQSIVTAYIPNVAGGGVNNSVHFLSLNESVLNVYQFFYGITAKPNTLAFWNKSRYKIELSDSSLIGKITSNKEGQEYEQWLQQNGHCYELIWNGIKSWKDKVEYLKEDLDRYFAKPLGIQVTLEKQLVPSNILVIQGNTDSLKTKGGTPVEKHDSYSYVQHNLPLSRFINQLGYLWQNDERTVFNDTNFENNVDLELNCNMSNKQAVNKELVKYGLRFVDGESEADVIVMRKKQNKSGEK